MKSLKSFAPFVLILLLLGVAIWLPPTRGNAAAIPKPTSPDMSAVLSDNHCAHPDSAPVIGASIGALNERLTAANKNSRTSNNLSLTGTTFISGFLRCPPGNPSNPTCSDISQWILADAGVAYYRDVITSVTVFGEGTHNGETSEAVFTRPDGTQFAGGPITYFTNGDCFQSGLQVVCGSNIATMYWYFNSQCNQVGQWRVDLKHDGIITDTSPFFIKPRLGVTLANWNQNSYPTTAFDTMCRDSSGKFVACSNPLGLGQTTVSVAEMGCTLTSLTTMLTYHGVSVDPLTLDQWLINNNGYEGNNCPGCIKNINIVIPQVCQERGQDHQLGETGYRRDQVV